MLLSLTLSSLFAATAQAANPPSNHVNSSNFGSLTAATDDPLADRPETAIQVAGLPPSGDMNPADMQNSTVDTSEVLSHEARPQRDRQAANPPSGDMNPADLGNAAVDTSEVLSHEARPTARRAGFPPSGDMNPSDRANRTVDTSEID
ncbi:hypothetical protein [Microcoleus sp. FACHB-1515]|uniref:hypothetical protein n=2 Tax=Cyanophyceae TaxID=3028117 RepID=UPI001A7F07F3|nr:hypothetical protein [Microcoleus sp. FACHB-1515]